MKILKIFAIVVGIHVFALVLIFANPGCSSTAKPQPAPSDTVAATAPTSTPISVPGAASTYAATDAGAGASPPISFNPDAPAVAASSSGSGSLRVSPTRPGTPAAGVLVAEPVKDVTPATTYVVKSGESLWSVAKKHHLTVAELTAANSLAANAALRPGQKLKIPGKSGAAAPAAAAATTTTAAAPSAKSADTTATPAAARGSNDVVKHTVKSGETLGAIARSYGVKASEIAVANNISDPAKIKAGDQLTIPGWQTPGGGKSGKASKSSGGAGKSSEPKASAPAEPAAATPLPTTPPPVPIIRIPDSPVTPAPKP